MTALNFIVARLAQALLVMAVISIIGFAVKASLGDPVRELLAKRRPPKRAGICAKVLVSMTHGRRSMAGSSPPRCRAISAHPTSLSARRLA